ncbi:MAG: cytochrome C oxidase subunit IV family protein [Acidobacteria bacterium]|nr:cytochrome C oxidase subunit IV family protein [Acidobacteriota bacterium]
MTETATTVEAEVERHDEHDHPSDRSYVGVAAVLGLITAAEVLTYFFDVGPFLIPALMVMMTAKFFIVAAYFMHLKQDIPLFSGFFVGGIALASIVYITMLTTFEFWDSFDF